ncbi:hypothetical protein ACFYYR_31260 [Streptomyces sp. NPDC001922]|uniref:hypothetical protein n=1 Tax=Streptomyces sp. NPDC001922 TaxID=3364624 RepID=UPI0036AEC1C6
MNIRRILTGSALLAVLAVQPMAANAASAAPAEATASTANAAPDCQRWPDSNTFGTYCSYADGNRYFRAMAKCKNGRTVPGQWKRVGSGTWSYAYCTSVNSSLSYGWAEIGN